MPNDNSLRSDASSEEKEKLLAAANAKAAVNQANN